MAKPYSFSLRRKVIEAIELDGMKRSEASKTFRISRNTINLWFQRRAETGDFLALPRESPGHSHKSTDWQGFQAFVEQNPDQTLREMANLWPGAISQRTISRGLQKIGFTRKKKPRAIRNAMSKSVPTYIHTTRKTNKPFAMSRSSLPMKPGWTPETTMPMATASKGSASMP